MTALAAFVLLLHRLTGARDLVVGTPLSNRPRAELEGLIGLFLNNVALRVSVAADGTFEDLLREVRGVTLAAYEHRHLPFDELLRELGRTRPAERMPLYRVFFNMIDFPEGELALPGLVVDEISSPDAASKMDVALYLMASAWPKHLTKPLTLPVRSWRWRLKACRYARCWWTKPPQLNPRSTWASPTIVVRASQ